MLSARKYEHIRLVFLKIMKRDIAEYHTHILLLALCLSLHFPGLQGLYYNFHKLSASFKLTDTAQVGEFGFLLFIYLLKVSKIK